jgi:hypothetical protein
MVIILPVAMLVYFSAALFLRTIPGEDLRAIYQAIRVKTLALPPTSPASLLVQDGQIGSEEELSEEEILERSSHEG